MFAYFSLTAFASIRGCELLTRLDVNPGVAHVLLELDFHQLSFIQRMQIRIYLPIPWSVRCTFIVVCPMNPKRWPLETGVLLFFFFFFFWCCYHMRFCVTVCVVPLLRCIAQSPDWFYYHQLYYAAEKFMWRWLDEMLMEKQYFNLSSVKLLLWIGFEYLEPSRNRNQTQRYFDTRNFRPGTVNSESL